MTDLQETGVAPHPEAMTAAAELRLGGTVHMRATARATPAGLVAVALLLCAVMVPLAWIGVARARAR